jgi:hypothetical protein
LAFLEGFSMPDRSELIYVGEAAARVGLTDRSFRRRLAEGEIRIFRDPLDRRRRLVPVEDLPRLTTITPIDRSQEMPAAS